MARRLAVVSSWCVVFIVCMVRLHPRQGSGVSNTCVAEEREKHPPALRQYSLGRSTVVAERSASVIIQNFMPEREWYADNSRNRSPSEYSFSCLSSASTSPQSPDR